MRISLIFWPFKTSNIAHYTSKKGCKYREKNSSSGSQWGSFFLKYHSYFWINQPNMKIWILNSEFSQISQPMRKRFTCWFLCLFVGTSGLWNLDPVTKIVFKLPNQIIMVSHILGEDLKDNGGEPSKMELNGPRRKSMVGERFTERIDNKVIMALLLWYFWSG